MTEPHRITVICCRWACMYAIPSSRLEAYIRSQLHSILSGVSKISVFTLSATIRFQGTDFYNTKIVVVIVNE
jgi:hypothetical protein